MLLTTVLGGWWYPFLFVLHHRSIVKDLSAFWKSFLKNVYKTGLTKAVPNLSRIIIQSAQKGIAKSIDNRSLNNESKKYGNQPNTKLMNIDKYTITTFLSFSFRFRDASDSRERLRCVISRLRRISRLITINMCRYANSMTRKGASTSAVRQIAV